MSIKNMGKINRALVTGGAGFIGSNLTLQLLNNGCEVTVFDNLSRRGSEKNLVWLLQNHNAKNLRVEVKDIRDFAAIKEAVASVDAVFHLAAQVAVTTSFLNPREDFEVNALGSFNVLEAARQVNHPPILIFSSTNKVYGAMDKIKVKKNSSRYAYVDFPEGIAEDYPLDFHSPYGCSNGVADQYTRDYYRMYGIPTVVFRQSCIYGPRQMGMEAQGWVAYLAISAYKGRPITIYGDGKQVRDILYVDDLVAAYLAAVAKIEKVAGEVYNIGGGKENALSLLEYLRLLGKKINRKVKIKYAEWRPGDQKVFISNNAKLKKELGWVPKTSFKEGVDKLLDWIKENKNLFTW